LISGEEVVKNWPDNENYRCIKLIKQKILLPHNRDNYSKKNSIIVGRTIKVSQLPRAVIISIILDFRRYLHSLRLFSVNFIEKIQK
jgi:hypothetical protein